MSTSGGAHPPSNRASFSGTTPAAAVRAPHAMGVPLTTTGGAAPPPSAVYVAGSGGALQQSAMRSTDPHEDPGHAMAAAYGPPAAVASRGASAGEPALQQPALQQPTAAAPSPRHSSAGHADQPRHPTHAAAQAHGRPASTGPATPPPTSSMPSAPPPPQPPAAPPSGAPERASTRGEPTGQAEGEAPGRESGRVPDSDRATAQGPPFGAGPVAVVSVPGHRRSDHHGPPLRAHHGAERYGDPRDARGAAGGGRERSDAGNATSAPMRPAPSAHQSSGNAKHEVAVAGPSHLHHAPSDALSHPGHGRREPSNPGHGQPVSPRFDGGRRLSRAGSGSDRRGRDGGGRGGRGRDGPPGEITHRRSGEYGRGRGGRGGRGGGRHEELSPEEMRARELARLEAEMFGGAESAGGGAREEELSAEEKKARELARLEAEMFGEEASAAEADVGVPAASNMEGGGLTWADEVAEDEMKHPERYPVTEVEGEAKERYPGPTHYFGKCVFDGD